LDIFSDAFALVDSKDGAKKSYYRRCLPKRVLVGCRRKLFSFDMHQNIEKDGELSRRQLSWEKIGAAGRYTM